MDLDRYNPTEVLKLRAVAIPEIRGDEVLVRVCAAGVDRGAWHVMAGLPYPLRLAGFGLPRPKAPTIGREAAGIVEAVGARVTGLAPGDEVFGFCNGAFAEYAAAAPAKLAPKPSNLTLAQARRCARLRLGTPSEHSSVLTCPPAAESVGSPWR